MTPPVAEPRFNLVDEPWLLTLGADGTVREVSIRQAFHDADELRGIAGELPTQAFATLRLLLAVLHRAVDGPAGLDVWRQVRDDWPAAVAEVDAYLDTFHDRFWLQHPVHPFLQVPDLRTAKGEVFGLSRIVCDGPGTSPFLTTRLGERLETAAWPEAARWLVHAHAYDVSGIHSGAEGDPRVNGGKGYGIGTGWAGQIGGVHVVGSTLRETLVLNLLAPSEIGLDGGGHDRPVWERAPLGAAPEEWDGEHYRQPTGLVDLYTWPARRIRLFFDGDVATGCINAQGDRATPQNRQRLEPMTAWRYSEAQSKKAGHTTYMPLKHEPGRALWRGLAALLPHAGGTTGGTQPAARLTPSLLRWVERLQGVGEIGDGLLRLQAVGADYGSNESVYGEIVADQLELPTALFDPDLRQHAEAAVAAVEAADQAVLALANLAQNVALAAGGSTEATGPRDRAREQAYAALDHEFREWVRTLGSTARPGERSAAWHRRARDVVQRLADQVIDDAGPAALVGRVAGGRFRDAGQAELWFRKRLREALPLAFIDDADRRNQEVA